jgi:hypothetical protein
MSPVAPGKTEFKPRFPRVLNAPATPSKSAKREKRPECIHHETRTHFQRSARSPSGN